MQRKGKLWLTLLVIMFIFVFRSLYSSWIDTDLSHGPQCLPRLPDHPRDFRDLIATGQGTDRKSFQFDPSHNTGGQEVMDEYVVKENAMDEKAVGEKVIVQVVGKNGKGGNVLDKIVSSHDSYSSRLFPVPKPHLTQEEVPSTLPPSWEFKPKNLSRLQQVLNTLETTFDDVTAFGNTAYFLPRPTLVTTFRPEVLISSPPCPSHSPPFLLILMPSMDVNFQERRAVRDTWASPIYVTQWPGESRNILSVVKLVFVLGVKTQKKSAALLEESRKFGDIVQLDFVESYRNLSLKMGLFMEWSATYCANAGHVMKVDIDTFVDLPLLLDLLTLMAREGVRRYILGHHHNKERPPVVRHGRWAVPYDLYPLSHFPRYVYGHSYVMSREAAHEVGRWWRHLPLVVNEDAFLTGIVAKAAGLSRFHCQWFAADYSKDLYKEPVGGRVVTRTRFKPFHALIKMWGEYKKLYGNVSAQNQT